MTSEIDKIMNERADRRVTKKKLQEKIDELEKTLENLDSQLKPDQTGLKAKIVRKSKTPNPINHYDVELQQFIRIDFDDYWGKSGTLPKGFYKVPPINILSYRIKKEAKKLIKEGRCIICKSFLKESEKFVCTDCTNNIPEKYIPYLDAKLEHWQVYKVPLIKRMALKLKLAEIKK